jgi:hypothetical protein
LHHRFVVSGYVRKRVTLRISIGLRVVALAVGITRRVLGDTRVIFITIIAIYIALAEKIRTPLIILVSDFHGLLGEHPQFHPRNSFFFSILSKKSHTKKLGFLVFCHSLDCIELFLVADRSSLA